MIFFAILAVSVFINSVVFHELGHFFYFRWILKREVEVRFLKKEGYRIIVGHPSDYGGLSKIHKINSFLAGILAGLIPLLWISSWLTMYCLMIPIYLIACIPDIRNIWRLIK